MDILEIINACEIKKLKDFPTIFFHITKNNKLLFYQSYEMRLVKINFELILSILKTQHYLSDIELNKEIYKQLNSHFEFSEYLYSKIPQDEILFFETITKYDR